MDYIYTMSTSPKPSVRGKKWRSSITVTPFMNMIADPQPAKTETNVFTTSNTGVISFMLFPHRNSRCTFSLPPASGGQCRVGGLAILRQVDLSSRDMEDSTTREVQASSNRGNLVFSSSGRVVLSNTDMGVIISSSRNVEVIIISSRDMVDSSSRDSRNEGAETTAVP